MPPEQNQNFNNPPSQNISPQGFEQTPPPSVGKGLIWALSIVIVILLATIFYLAYEQYFRSSSVEENAIVEEKGDGEKMMGNEKVTEVPSDWKTYVNDEIGVSFRYPESQFNPSSVVVGFATHLILIANRIEDFERKETYSNLSDFVSDLKIKKPGTVLSEIQVGGRSGYEIFVNGKAGVWVENDDAKIYTFYFDKGSLSSLDRRVLDTVSF